MIRSFLYWLFLAAPLAVIFRPAFQTTFAEDILAGTLWVYLTLRALNEKRLPLSPHHAYLLNTAALALGIGIAWLGLIRGYYEAYGKWVILFPMCWLAALLFQHHRSPKNTPPDGHTLSTRLSRLSIALNLILFSVLILAGRIIHREANEYYQLSKHLLVPLICVVPILSLSALHAKYMPRLQSGKQHLHLWIPFLLLSTVAWSGNAKTWTLWYTAGQLERAWTPFRFDRISQPHEYRQTNRKPPQAIRYYEQTRQRLRHKGSLPQFWQWDFMLQYRMAYQGRRLNQAALSLQMLPPSSLSKPSHIQTLQQLWDTEFLTGMLHQNDLETTPHRMMIDVEWDPAHHRMLVMDLFGRVFSQTQTEWQPVWKPETLFANAADLELTAHGITVAAADGRIFFEHDNPFWKTLAIPLEAHERLIDMEWIAPDASVALTDYGTLHFIGNVPHSIPRQQAFQFGRPLAADLEIDPSGNGVYLLDRFGGIHASHTSEKPSLPHSSPEIDSSLLPYWLNQLMAVDMELDPAHGGIYLYNRMGELYTVAPRPYRKTFHPPVPAPFKGTAFTQKQPGDLYALEANGKIIPLPDEFPLPE